MIIQNKKKKKNKRRGRLESGFIWDWLHKDIVVYDLRF